MAKYYPNGAIKSVEEFLLLCKKQKIFYIVDDDMVDPPGVIWKVPVEIPFITVDHLSPAQRHLNGSNQRALNSINLEKASPSFEKDFIFANYWHALAYSMKCKQKQMEATND